MQTNSPSSGRLGTSGQGKNPKCRVSSYFHSSFSPISSPHGDSKPVGPIFLTLRGTHYPLPNLKNIIRIYENAKKPATSDSSLDPTSLNFHWKGYLSACKKEKKLQCEFIFMYVGWFTFSVLCIFYRVKEILCFLYENLRLSDYAHSQTFAFFSSRRNSINQSNTLIITKVKLSKIIRLSPEDLTQSNIIGLRPDYKVIAVTKQIWM